MNWENIWKILGHFEKYKYYLNILFCLKTTEYYLSTANFMYIIKKCVQME